jgi:hypothetical protein
MSHAFTSHRRPARHARALAATALMWGTALLSQGAHAATDTYLKGSFGPVVSWPLIPIHIVLLPDGRLMSYGTDGAGNQTGQFIYDVWNPALGTAAASHLTLPNTTGTDTFCSGQVVLPASGAVLLTGGDRTIDGLRNFSSNDVNLFDYRSNALYSAQQPMAALRWYPTVLTTASGEILVLGGRIDPKTPASTPEVFTEGSGWRALSSVTSDDAYGLNNWSYPRAWQAPNGKVFIATIWGGTYSLDIAGTGTLEKTPLTLAAGDVYLPSVMYSPGKILALRKANKAVSIDITGAVPKATTAASVGQDRFHGSLTVMADGKVLMSGGSIWSNKAIGVAYVTKIWNPATNKWATAARAAKMRLYHSTSILLPDARVLTGGGGAPGPVTNTNAEVYTPPYLYKQDRTATLAPRPSITAAPATATWGKPITVETDASGVSLVSLVRTGSATHTLDFDQRFQKLSFSGAAKSLSVTMPASANDAPPGYYMLFVFNSAGVPSVAKIIKLG